MADLIFYTNPQSRGRIVRWMLEEVGRPYETEVVPCGEIKSAAYLAINPAAANSSTASAQAAAAYKNLLAALGG